MLIRARPPKLWSYPTGRLINKLVVENLRHRPLRTLLSVIAIGVQVTMVLTLVGLSRGMLEDQQRRARGVGADILVRAPGSSLIGFSTNMSSKYLDFIRKQPHVRVATAVLVQATGGLNSVTGLDLPSFNALSGGFHFLSGGAFNGPDQMVIDRYYADQFKLKAGDVVNVLNRSWKIVGIVEPGMLAREVVPLEVLQDLTANTGKITMIYVKLDDPARTNEVVAQLREKLTSSPIYSMEEYVSMFSVANVPMLREFIAIIIGLGILVGFLVVFLSMYTAVLERTREIGVLKALGASPAYVLNILLRETTLLAVFGALLGIGLTYGSRWLIMGLVPGSLIQAIVPDWWPIAGGLALGGALLGALYPGWKAARQDAIEALAYD
jgi:putative ABC transport system permease protein